MDRLSPLSQSGNGLLRLLPPGDVELIHADLEPVTLEVRHWMERPRQTIKHVYFPESGVTSVVALGKGDRRIEVGLFGREGMSGSTVVLGNDVSPHETYVQLAGEGQRISSDALRSAMNRSATLRVFLLHYVQVFMIQTAHTALANGRANLEERLARWLLMCHDRIDGDDLSLTHEFLALMLGVRRPGVTAALHELEQKGLIKAGRGSVRVADRDGLVLVANGSYGVPEAEYQRLVASSLAASA
jgi:CRP-like cAMP-binding protein